MPNCTLCRNTGIELFQTERFRDYVINPSHQTIWKICQDCIHEGEVIRCENCNGLFPNPLRYCSERSNEVNIYRDGKIINTIQTNVFNRLAYSESAGWICDRCIYTDNYFFCICCNRLFARHDRDSITANTCVYCSYYQSAIARRRTLEQIRKGLIKGEIFPYEYDPLNELDFLGTPKDRLFYGIELELESDKRKRYDLARRTNNYLENFAILKEDGSLNCGFEIVSAPATLEIHKKKWQAFFQKMTFNKRGLRQSERTGLHIHVSREPLSALTIGKILVFINEPKHRHHISALAGRESCPAAQLKQKNLTDSLKRPSSRYEAINLTKPGTIEFRIFASTTDYKELMMRLEFTAATIAFCQATSLKNLDWTDFINWLLDYRKQYKFLWDFLLAQMLLQLTKVGN